MRNSSSSLITFLKKKYRSTLRKCRSSHRRCSVKNVFLKISQTSQDNTLFQEKTFKINLQAFSLRLQHKCFSLKFGKILRTPILMNICERLLLKMCSWNWEILRFIHKKVFEKKPRFFEHQYQKQVHDSYFMIGFPWKFLCCGEK